MLFGTRQRVLLRLVKNYFKKEAIVSARESCEIDLYSLRTNSWKRIPATEFGYSTEIIVPAQMGFSIVWHL